MKIHEYCCCAIPLLNFGIYATLLEQVILSALAGTLSIATPSIVGASLPSFAPWVFAIVCYVVTAIQILGFLGVARENLKLYKTYLWLNSLAVPIAFGVAGAFIGISAGRHNTALSDCQKDFFESADGVDPTDDKSRTLCNIFTWVDIGLMAGLWVVLAIFQLYLLVVTRFYGNSQREDHKKYYSLYAVNGTEDIPLADRPGEDAWDTRELPPLDQPASDGRNEYSHVRQASNASTIMNEPIEQPNRTYTHYASREPGDRYDDDDNVYDQPDHRHQDSFPQQYGQERYEYPDNATQTYTVPSYHTNAPNPQR